MNRFN
ncbi:hypothetical protein CP03DC29_0773A, partial [Chlamydia psittaci 03DC29]